MLIGRVNRLGGAFMVDLVENAEAEEKGKEKAT